MKMYKIVTALLIAVALANCTPKVEEDHPHDEKLMLTAYSADFEIFAEATPFVIGQTSDILAHFTYLKNFKPVTSGSIKASLIIGEDGIRQTLDKPTSPGIYKFSLQPKIAGTGMLVFDIQTPEGASQIVVQGIKVYTDVHEAQHDATAMAITSSNGAVFTKEQSWKVDFATTRVNQEPFGQIIHATGQIQPAHGDERMIAAKASGMVNFLGDNIVEGKAINAGQSLFSIDGSGMADNNLSVRFSEAKSEYNRAKVEYDRKTELAKDNIVSQSDLLKARTDFTNAEANYNSLNRNFSSGKQNVTSPIGGFITRILVRNGQYAESGQPVMVVSQNRDLFIKAEVRPKYFEILGNVTSANFRILDNDRTYTLEDLEGRLVSYSKSTDINNPLISVIFQVNNKAGLLSGSFVEMFIKTQTNAQAITVPKEAIVEEMGNYFVFVQLTPEFFEKRAVKTGSTDGIRTEVTGGIAAGDRVVSTGAILVKLAQAAGAIDAHSGHVH